MRFSFASIIILLLLLLLLFYGCGPGMEDDLDSRTGETEESDDDSGISPGDDDDDSDNFIERTIIGEDWDCDDPATCKADYKLFIKIAKEFASPVTNAEIEQQFSDIAGGLVTPIEGELPADELRQSIITAMNIPFLIDGLENRLLTVTTIRVEQHDQYTEKEILLTDKYIGTTKGLLLLPNNSPPHKALLVNHGHGQNAQVYHEAYQAERFAKKGYATLILNMRVMGADEDEDEMSRLMLRQGFSLLGIRMYESLLGAKYLRLASAVKATGIGLLGHSGGSISNNVLIRIQPNFSACVTDALGNFIRDWDTPIIDEALPALFPYHVLINDFDTASVPVLQVPYEYADGFDPIFDFFDQYL